MIHDQDILLRQIQILITGFSKLFNKEMPYTEASDPNNSALDSLHRRLIDLLNQNRFNEAENLLFEQIDTSKNNNFILALDFYSRLNGFTDEVLINNDYTRQEIKDGLEELSRLFGYGSVCNSIQAQ